MASDVIRDADNMTLSEEEISDRVRYHAPSPAGVKRHEALSGFFAELITEVDMIVPKGREKSLSLTKLEEAKFWASAGVARNEETR